MKKRLFAYICALALLAGVLPSAGALEGEALRAADRLAALGLVENPGSGDYGLNAPATRAQAVVLLVRMAGAAEEAKSGARDSGFLDVPAGADAEIAYASDRGWAGGVRQGEFQPDSAVTANAWFSFLLRMLGYSDRDGDFSVGEAAAFARRIGLTPRSYSGSLTRGDLYQSAADALTFPYRDGSATVVGRMVESAPSLRAAANALGLLDAVLTARQVSDRLTSAVFCLDVYNQPQRISTGRPNSTSSGFFISAGGLAVTCYHSIRGAVYGTATLSTGEVYEVERVIYYNEGADIAVLRISRTSTGGGAVSAFNHLELAGSGDVRPGDVVYSLGNPLGLGLAVSQGIVSAAEREVEGYAVPCIVNTADISSGSSGGALMNARGQVIAVSIGAYARGNSMYLGVPADTVMAADLTAQGLTLAELAAQTAEED